MKIVDYGASWCEMPPHCNRLLLSQDLRRFHNGCEVRARDIGTLRQQPDTINVTIIVSLEGEQGTVQVIVWRHAREAQC